jgi:hypothetical protein
LNVAPATQLEQKKFERMLNRIEAKLPDRLAQWVYWLVSPSAKLLRVPLGLLLIAGGVFSFLPVLGIEMLPLGILLVAVDVPSVRHWVVRFGPKLEARWRLLRSRWRKFRSSRASGADSAD